MPGDLGGGHRSMYAAIVEEGFGANEGERDGDARDELLPPFELL